MMATYHGFIKDRSKNVLDFFNEQVILLTSTNGGNMKEGDLVECLWGEIGIVLWQVGVADRYMVYWIGICERYALNGCNLFYIGE
jgi:hypothetical protein